MNVPEPESHTDGKLPRPYACTYAPCHKSFSRRSDLVRHVRIHTNERPYKCEFKSCGKCFIQRSALTVHMRTHTGERPHVCEQCGRAFSDSSSLARHRRVHTGKRPYRCPFAGCDKTFCRKTTLMKHHKSHSDDSLSFHSDSGSPKSNSAHQSPSNSPSCTTSFNPQYAHSAYVGRVSQNMSAPASSQSFPHLPHPSSYAIPPWSSVSATFSIPLQSPRENFSATNSAFPAGLQSHNFLLPVISPRPSPINCNTFFSRHPSLNQAFPQVEREMFNPAGAYSATPHYGNDPQDLYRQIPKPRDSGGLPSQLSTVLDQPSFFGTIDANSQMFTETSHGTQPDLLYESFPQQISNVEPIAGLDLSGNMHPLGNRQQSFHTEHPVAPLSHFGFGEPLVTNAEDTNSCWQKLNWDRN